MNIIEIVAIVALVLALIGGWHMLATWYEKDAFKS